MKGLGVTTSYKAEELKPHADEVVDSLGRLPVEHLEKLFL